MIYVANLKYPLRGPYVKSRGKKRLSRGFSVVDPFFPSASWLRSSSSSFRIDLWISWIQNRSAERARTRIRLSRRLNYNVDVPTGENQIIGFSVRPVVKHRPLDALNGETYRGIFVMFRAAGNARWWWLIRLIYLARTTGVLWHESKQLDIRKLDIERDIEMPLPRSLLQLWVRIT